MPIDPRSPCIVGVAQCTIRPDDGPAPEPLELWADVARAAADDAKSVDLLAALDSVQVVYCQSWQYDDPVGRLSERLNIQPKHRHYSGIGGTTPQALISDIAEAMLGGELESALVVGAEALWTKRVLKKQGERTPWSFRDPEKKPFPFEVMPHAGEIAHEVFQAYVTFAMFDNARRAAHGATPETDRAEIGALMAPMTEIAAANPHAWFPITRTAEQLIKPTADNRMVSWPYTKHTVSVMDVDMAAAAIVMTHEAADRLGIPADKRVYLRGWAFARDPWYVAERADMARSVAMRLAAEAAFANAGITVDDVNHFDLYSCFPASLRFAADALGIDVLDKRGFTVTGGLPFAGGPASNYMLHSVATMTETLRGAPGDYGIVSGVGFHMTKHAYAVYSTQPGLLEPPDKQALEAQAAAQPTRPIVESYDGEATVAAYTIEHGRDGAPVRGFLVVDIANVGRAYARVDEPDLLADAETRELVGQTVTLLSENKVNTARW